ncbi:lysylphosphatidylglycerol synthase transmembrane domain-containing protein [Lunatibacter salilacus]|uniref:lysylphosphatidylglycerol synthase transmembrane domain-containing protein n=1 Tax=Lunatibacter salilacus TaxID=2483804 RepID=UPI00131D877D|nr:lysylphosphatidylglycerol synthase transmembrane domain-containing protein [Lunatibacter salilacus]
MKLSVRQFVQLVASLLLGMGIFWLLYKDIALDQLKQALIQTSFLWIAVSVVVSLLGYWIRAWRWKMLIEAGEKQSFTTIRIFWALMFGYLVNLIIPRAGEVARCGVLKRTDSIPMGSLFGTVVVERTVDMLCMLGTIILAFLLERAVFLELLESLVDLEKLKTGLIEWLPYLVTILLVFFGFLYWLYLRFRSSGRFLKFRQFLRQFVRGIKSVSDLEHPVAFWISTISVWVIYYAMMYFVAMAIPSTAGLNASSVLMIMVMGSIGMVVPVQGGIGTFHALVAFILLFYGIAEEEGKIFAMIVHGSQVLTIFIVGLVSSVILAKLTWKGKPKIR